MTIGNCPICTGGLIAAPVSSSRGGQVYHCANCGRYELSGTFEQVLRASQEAPARLAILSHAVRRMQRDNDVAHISTHVAEAIWRGDRLPTAAEQFDNLVLYLGTTLSEPGATVDLNPQDLRALLGSITASAAGWVLKTCQEQGLVEGIVTQTISEPTSLLQATLSPAGWYRFQELQVQARGSRRAFMAMRFGDDQMDRMFFDHFKPATLRAGFELMKLDEEPRAGLIDDRLRLEIRRSRFLVADLSHGNPGAYWEAGYAEGLGRPVIYTCRKDIFEDPRTKPHFDTNHHLTIVWDPNQPDKAGEQLATTIRVTLPSEARLEDG